jgi:hypothetical protein
MTAASFVKLTPLGEASFDEVFPHVVAEGDKHFADYSEADYQALEDALEKLKQHFSTENNIYILPQYIKRPNVSADIRPFLLK